MHEEQSSSRQRCPGAGDLCLLQELRRYIDFFKQSGKFAISYMYTGGEICPEKLSLPFFIFHPLPFNQVAFKVHALLQLL